jgi:hypothetical protein
MSSASVNTRSTCTQVGSGVPERDGLRDDRDRLRWVLLREEPDALLFRSGAAGASRCEASVCESGPRSGPEGLGLVGPGGLPDGDAFAA